MMVMVRGYFIWFLFSLCDIEIVFDDNFEQR